LTTPVGLPMSALLNFAAAAGLLYFFSSILWPLALAGVFVVLIESVAQRITRLLPRAPRWGVFVLTSLFTGGLGLAAVLVILEGLYQLIEKLPAVQQRIEAALATVTLPGGASLKLADLAASVDTNALMEKALGGLKDTTSGLVLTALYLAFLLASRPMIDRRIRAINHKRRSPGLIKVIQDSVSAVEAYVSIQTLTGLMIGAGSAVVMMLAGLENAILWGLIIFLFAYLPVVGVFIGSLGPTLFALLQFSTPYEAIVIFAAVQAVSFFVGNLVLPKMQADSQNIDPSAGLLAVGAWTIVWGIPGAFLAIPLTLAAMYALARSERLGWVAILLSNDGEPVKDDKALTA